MITRFATRIDPVESRLKVAAELELAAHATPARFHVKRAKLMNDAREIFNNAMAADFMFDHRINPNSLPNVAASCHRLAHGQFSL